MLFLLNVRTDLDAQILFGVSLLRWILFGTSLALALLASRLVEWFVGQRVRALVARSGKEFETRLIDLLTPVIRWAILLLVARQGMHHLQPPANIEEFIVDLFKAAYAMLVAVLASQLLGLFLESWADHSTEIRNQQLRASLVPAMRKLANVFIFTIAGLLILSNAGYNVGSLLAGLGIGGLAVALAAQETLANLFGSITIFMDKPFYIGDRIQLDKYDGNVERVGLRCTEIRQLDGSVAIVPNRVISQNSLLNISRRPAIRHTFTLGLATDTAPEKVLLALDLVRDIFRQHPLTKEVTLSWRDYGSSSLDVPVIYWCNTTDYTVFLQALQDINVRIKQQFDANGIAFSTPPQLVMVKSV